MSHLMSGGQLIESTTGEPVFPRIIKSSVYAGTLKITSPYILPVHTDTFTPSDVQALFEADISVGFDESGSSSMVWTLYYALSSNPGPLTPRHQGDALTGGVTQVILGTAGGQRSMMSARAMLTGLTPGSLYKFELSCGIVGGAVLLPVAGGPFALATGKQVTGPPELANVLAVKSSTAGTLALIRARHFRAVAEDEYPASAIALTGGATAGRIAMTPDGSKVVVCQQGANNVAVVTTNAAAFASWAPVVQGYYTAPGAAPAPTGVACSPNGTDAWVTLGALGQIVKMTIATGAFGAAVGLGFGTCFPQDVDVDPTGATVLAVTNGGGTAGTGQLVKVRTSDGAVLGSLALNGAAGVVWDPLGADLAYVIGNQRVYKVRPSDMTLLATSADLGVALTAIDIFPDGLNILASSSTGGATGHVQQLRCDDLTRYVTFDFGAGHACYDVAIGVYGVIFVADFTANLIHDYPDGQVNLRPNNGYYGEALRTFVSPAT